MKSRIGLKRGGDRGVYGNGMNSEKYKMYEQQRSPRSILEFNVERGQHPTQKPVPLFTYLIKTYTLPDETVLDNCVGSGTTMLACKESGRKCIAIEKEEKYCEIAAKRCGQEVLNFGGNF